MTMKSRSHQIDCFKGCYGVLAICIIAMQLYLSYVVKETASAMAAEWEQELSSFGAGSQSVEVISKPFWGPVKVITPLNCSKVLHRNQQIRLLYEDAGIDLQGSCWSSKHHEWVDIYRQTPSVQNTSSNSSTEDKEPEGKQGDFQFHFFRRLQTLLEKSPFASEEKLDCSYTWNEWSSCSTSCGWGSRSQSPVITREASNGGMPCPLQKEQPCFLEQCPVDCSFTLEPWTECSATCGGGIQTQAASILVSASDGGKACPEQVSRECNIVQCAHGCSTVWSPWSACSTSCGDGTRSRTAAVPDASNASCEPTQAEQCTSQPCDVLSAEEKRWNKFKLDAQRLEANLWSQASNLTGVNAWQNFAQKVEHVAANFVPFKLQWPYINIPICNSTDFQTFGVPRFKDRYFSMILLEAAARELTSDDKAFRHVRLKYFLWLLRSTYVIMFLRYHAKLMQFLVDGLGMKCCVGPSGRTRLDHGLESLILHSTTSIYCLGVQISLCSAFLLVWRENHYVMTFIPAIGFFINFGYLILLTTINELDKVFKWSAKRCYQNNCALIWICWLAITLIVNIPVVTVTIYNIQFLVSAIKCHWFVEEGQLVSPEFANSAERCVSASIAFVVMAVVEQIVFFAMDSAATSQTVAPQAPDAVKATLMSLRDIRICEDCPLIGGSCEHA